MSTSNVVSLLVIITVLVATTLSAPAPDPSIIDDLDHAVEDSINKLSKYCGDSLCAESSPIHYYQCCGNPFEMKCCLRVKDWVVPAAVGVVVFLLGACIASCFQCR